MTPAPIADGCRADSARRRQHVIKAVAAAVKADTPITVSGITRQAGVDRAFLYRHKDLLAQVHAADSEPRADSTGPLVTCASLQADLANAQERAGRLTARIRTLEGKLSELLGEQASREAPDSADATTSTSSSAAPPPSNSKRSISPADWKSATKNSRPPELPTAG